MGHMALNANPVHVVTPVTVVSWLAWATSEREFAAPTWKPAWSAIGKADFLSIFDEVNTTQLGVIKSQRFHVAIDEIMPSLIPPNRHFVCVRFDATDDYMAISAAIDMNPLGYADSQYSTPSTYLAAHNARCFNLIQLRQLQSV